jgi:endonuclease YncB( thermonuclease family)
MLFLSLALMGGPPIYGTAVAGDGDSFRIGETRYRLYGIDAPEFDQTCNRGSEVWACGKVASDYLSKLITGRDVRCAQVSTDTFGRILAKCTVNGTDVNRTMVASGYAVAFRRYATDYVSAEDAARNNRRGLWAGTFEMPSEVRAASRHPVTSPHRENRTVSKQERTSVGTSASCAIKGNHSRRGEWIYHVPGMPYYAQTRAEAVFCSEADARAAGYRRAKVR